MSFKKELEECIESIRAIEMSFLIAKDMEVLLSSFFENNFDRLTLLDKQLRQIKRKQSKRRFLQFLHGKTEKSTPEKQVQAAKDKSPVQQQFSCVHSGLTLNDRFRIRKDLFNNNEEEMECVMNQINALSSMEEVRQYLEEMFNWDEENETVQMWMEILEKRFAG